MDAFRSMVRCAEWKETVRGQVEQAEGSRVQVLAALIVRAAWLPARLRVEGKR